MEIKIKELFKEKVYWFNKANACGGGDGERRVQGDGEGRGEVVENGIGGENALES